MGSVKIYLFNFIHMCINLFISERLILEEKNESIHSKNASNLTNEFLNNHFKNTFLVKIVIQKLIYHQV